VGAKNWGKIGKGSLYFHFRQIRSYFSDPKPVCKISSKSNQNCSCRNVYRQTDGQTVWCQV